MMGYAAVAAGVAILALSCWAFFERSRYMECRSTTVALKDQVSTLSDKMDTQNKAVEDSAKAAAQTLKQAGELLDKAKRENAKSAPALARLEAAIKEPAKRPDGTAKDCVDARREIRTGRKGGDQ